MLAMSGFLHRTVSRQIRSLAMAEPPGLSMRSTTATTLASSDALRRASIMVVEPRRSGAEHVAGALALDDLAHGIDHGDLWPRWPSRPACRR